MRAYKVRACKVRPPSHLPTSTSSPPHLITFHLPPPHLLTFHTGHAADCQLPNIEADRRVRLFAPLQLHSETHGAHDAGRSHIIGRYDVTKRSISDTPHHHAPRAFLSVPPGRDLSVASDGHSCVRGDELHALSQRADAKHRRVDTPSIALGRGAETHFSRDTCHTCFLTCCVMFQAFWGSVTLLCVRQVAMLCTLLAMGMWQIHYLKRYFQTKKIL